MQQTRQEQDTALAFDNVCCSYGSVEVLHNIDFAIPAKSLTGIVGPNGGGKTTLLKLVLGLVKPRYGSVSVFGLPPEEARGIVGYVPQSFLFDSAYPISVGEVVLSGLVDRIHLGSYSRDDVAASIAALERVGLADRRNDSFSDLSGGQRQRVLIAQALASSPKLLLLDEPVANVDERAAHALHALFADLAKEITVVMVSHNLNVVAACATHVLCVNHTADLHETAHMDHAHVFKDMFGDNYMIVEHDADCQVINDTRMHSPHAGA